MTEEQAARLIELVGRGEQWLTFGFILALVCCGWRLGSFFMRERSSLLHRGDQ